MRVAISFLLVLPLFMLSACTDHPKDTGSSPHSGHNHSRGESSSAKAEPKYVCPMHPQIVSDKPSSCPICGMDLVLAEDLEDDSMTASNGSHTEKDMNGTKEEIDTGGSDTKKEDEPAVETGSDTSIHGTHSKVRLTLNKQQMIGVKIAEIEARKLFKTIRAPGRVAFDPDLYTAQSEYLEALKQWTRVRNSPIASVRQSTREMIRSAEIRLKVLGLSESEIKRLGKRGEQTEGLLVSGKGQENYVYADVFEVDLPIIKKGQSAEITANFLQGRKLYGQVVSVDEVINPATRTAKVRIKLRRGTESIRPESYVNVAIYAPIGEHLSVPIDSIMDTGRDAFIFVQTTEERFEPRVVTLIQETEDFAAVQGAIRAGEKVVVGGNFMLDSESRLRAVIRKQIKSSQTKEHQH